MSDFSDPIRILIDHYKHGYLKDFNSKKLDEVYFECVLMLNNNDQQGNRPTNAKDDAIIEFICRNLDAERSEHEWDVADEYKVLEQGHVLLLHNYLVEKLHDNNPELTSEQWLPVLKTLLCCSKDIVRLEFSSLIVNNFMAGNPLGLMAELESLAALASLERLNADCEPMSDLCFQLESLTLPYHKFSVEEWTQLRDFMMEVSQYPVETYIYTGMFKTLVLNSIRFTFFGQKNGYPVFSVQINGCKVVDLRLHQFPNINKFESYADEINELLDEIAKNHKKRIPMDLFLSDL